MTTTAPYIVLLKDHVVKEHHFNWLRPQLSAQCEITNDFSIIHAFSGDFSNETYNILIRSDDVERVERDAELEWDTVINVESPSPWGLNRISQRDRLSVQDSSSQRFHYIFDDWMDVNIYILERGCRIGHEDFEGRATYAYGTPNSKVWKHGTEVTSCAGGKICGTAKHANLVICPVTDSPSRVTSAVKALEFVQKRCEENETPAVVNMSFSVSDPNNDITTLDKTVVAAIKSGIHCCASAGNDNGDAGTKTPARAQGCNTIGACTIKDERCSFSNYGSVLKLFAPGKSVLTADCSSDSKYSYHDGTSFSSPLVAGLIAYFISLYGNKTPEDMTKFLQRIALSGVLTDIPSGTVNLLAYNAAGHV